MRASADEQRVLEADANIASHHRRLGGEGNLRSAGGKHRPVIVVPEQAVGGFLHEHQIAHLGADTEEIAVRPSDEATCDRIVASAVARFGRIDILVVASGKNDVSKITEMAPARFLEVMDANVTQSWLIARAAGKQMLAQGDGGKVILMSSARGLLGHPAGYTAYCASKSAIDGITRALGCEWGPAGITVNAIAPTVFRSPLTAWMFGDDERARTTREGFLARVPKGRLGEPGDLAGPLLFLASKASDFYTGHILYADGGYAAG